MCGIVGAVADRNVSGILLEGLGRLEYRGYDSAGLAVLAPDGGLDLRRQVGKVRMLADDVATRPAPGRIGIAHTRWATHGVPSVTNAHPHVSGGRLALVHNGIIENHADLRAELTARGYVFQSETDTEVIVHLIEHLYRGITLIEAVQAAITRLEGAYGLAVIATDDPGHIVAARKGSPLVIGVGIGEHFLASDPLALRPVTDRFAFLEEGDVVELGRESFRVLDHSGAAVERVVQRLDLGRDDIDRGNYRHFMQKEIHQQPAVIRRTLEGRLGRAKVLAAFLGVGADSILDRARSVTLVACGTSFYAASVARYWIEELAGLPCQVEIASEFRYRTLAVPEGALFVSISQSGETADTLAALRIARQSGYFATVTLCNVATSSLARESDLRMMLEAGTEVGVASTKAFTAMLTNLLLLALMLARRHRPDPEREAECVAALHSLDAALEATLRLESTIARLAERFIDVDHALFLGRGTMFPIAMEGALKLKEISYIHAEGYPAGELKHGPLALVDERMPVVAVAPNDDVLEKLQSNLQEVRARGGELLVFADAALDLRAEPHVTIQNLPSVHRLLAPIVYVVPLQLLAYHVAVLRGTDVDQPRNLAKSVTVE
ncbi:MAG: glutamine--fructose-6-phosphate transaminase (isomerizing) [Gammaproteobacteria bacterium]